MSISRLPILVAILSLAATRAEAQNLVVNPGFESPAGAGITTRYTCACVPAGFGWTVGGGGVDLVETAWTPYEGAQSLDLNADNGGAATPPGAISQWIPTVPGTTYAVDFWMSANPDHSRAPDDGGPIKSVDVAFGSTTQENSVDVTARTPTSPGWVHVRFLSTPTTTSTLLSFTSASFGYAGPTLDDVSVQVWESMPAVASSWGRLKAGYR